MQPSKSNGENKKQKHKFQFQRNNELAPASNHNSNGMAAESSGVLEEVCVEGRVARSLLLQISKRARTTHFSRMRGIPWHAKALEGLSQVFEMGN